MARLTLDTGALVAIERYRKDMVGVVETARQAGASITVPATVIAEWWRGRTDGESAGRDVSRAFWEGASFAERFFMGLDEVHQALLRLTAALDAAGIPYAIAGAMAMNAHGYRRVTTHVDVLLTRAGLEQFKRQHLGRGWVERFPGSKGLRDTESNVKIDVLLSGDYPGDGKPKPVRFPDPSVAVQGDGFRVLAVRDLFELKLASGMTNADRLKDLADVQELVRHASLPLELADRLDPMVRGKYIEIWHATQRGPVDDE
jgi:hypothetical protein